MGGPFLSPDHGADTRPETKVDAALDLTVDAADHKLFPGENMADKDGIELALLQARYDEMERTVLTFREMAINTIRAAIIAFEEGDEEEGFTLLRQLTGDEQEPPTAEGGDGD